ncbi:phosphoglycerate mutase family protein, partial [Enterococcus hirae]
MLYVTRHGETTWNAAERVCGRADAPLTEKGQKQAEK